jgi:hypothetical protein
MIIRSTSEAAVFDSEELEAQGAEEPDPDKFTDPGTCPTMPWMTISIIAHL